MKKLIFTCSIGKSYKVAVFAILLMQIAFSPTTLQAEAEPILPLSDIVSDENNRAPAENPEGAKPSMMEPPPSTGTPKAAWRPQRFQFSFLGGVAMSGRDDLDPRIYKHKVERSPAGRFGFHYAFFTNKPFQLLVGADVVAIRSVAVASSSLATATYTANDVYMGPSVGFGWAPSGPGSDFQLQGLLTTGSEASHVATLESTGFTTNVQKRSLTSITIWYGLYGVYSITPKWRIMGGFAVINKMSPVMIGAAYAF